MTAVSFQTLEIAPAVLTALHTLGYESPTAIQAQSIPVLLSGQDLLAQAQTGTGKTAAFALPILSQLDLAQRAPQALIVVPTRELAIQVAEAFQRYARELPDFQVLPIYGGQEYRGQLKALKRGVHVVVGTPGRTMDHLRRGTFSTDALRWLVLDEADEMLKMGFIDDVEWIMSQLPESRQTALFSATLPAQIRKIAQQYQADDAHHIRIEPKAQSVDTIQQFYTVVYREQKWDLLNRYLEMEAWNAVMIFARTKTSTVEIAEKLQARGYAAAALNGDMPQVARQKVIAQLKSSGLDIVVATDVAARGIDVERISHVFNFDIPHDTEAYIHRVGRTGRAGRSGQSFLFVTPREKRLLRDIERAAAKQLTRLEPPSNKDLHVRRGEKLAGDVQQALLQRKKLKPYFKMVEQIVEQQQGDAAAVASALAYLLQKPSAPADDAPQAVPCDFVEPSKPKSRNGHKKRFDKRPGKPPFRGEKSKRPPRRGR